MEMQSEFISFIPRVVKTDAALQCRTKIHASTAQISRGFSTASVNATDFPFDCNRTAIAPLPLQAKAVSNERYVYRPISLIPLSRSITSVIRSDIHYMAIRVLVDVESFLLVA